MSKYIILGGNKLKGKITISGNKNSILPCMVAALLTEEEIILKNVPHISDVEVLSEILQMLGAEVKKGEHEITIKCEKISKTDLPQDLVKKLRASILFAGPLLSRMGHISFVFPGGDIIGRRTIDPHIEGLEKLGFEFKINDLTYQGKRGKNGHDKEIFLSECSVTGTENIILASVLGKVNIKIKNCASEPHVVDLCQMLISMGAQINGVGTATLEIKGVSKLKGTEFTIQSDHIEFGTYAVASALTGGEIEISKENLPDLEPVVSHLQKMGLIFKENIDSITVSAKEIKSIPKLHTNIWPGFPTDLMSAVIVLATKAQGMSLLHDWMYETRMFFVDKLISMGANITIADPHRVLVCGPTNLHGRNLETPDIRAGMALVLAALVANGQSIIDRAELIERGYENVVEKFTLLGANISKID
ncbi:MAG: UDP-N-acetylglucosamine 1-carboxyvinyltransferase [Candidatus Daviesbacteria bacterium]|nr:UDP-N-acetylglucosamine 1-carboxyvinyltransferase [Candidatus Daviesbacteria bacterium]